MSISQRINELVGYFSGGNVSRFAAGLGFSEANVRNYINGTQPKSDFFTKVVEVYEVNAEWLLTGEGPMLKTVVSRSVVEKIIPDEIINELDRENLEKKKIETELELMKKLYQMQQELLAEVKKDRDRLQKLLDEKK